MMPRTPFPRTALVCTALFLAPFAAATPAKDAAGASLLDPLGNIIGLIHNPHFDPTAVR